MRIRKIIVFPGPAVNAERNAGGLSAGRDTDHIIIAAAALYRREHETNPRGDSTSYSLFGFVEGAFTGGDHGRPRLTLGERLRKEGLIVNGKRYFITVIPPEDLLTPADLIIVAVKYHHLDDALRDMKNRVGAETAIMSVMNGIESEERIGAAYGMGKVLYAISVGIDALREGNRVNYNNQGKIFFGEARNVSLTDRVKRIQVLFDKAGIRYETPPDMMRIMWWKFMINVGINQEFSARLSSYFKPLKKPET